MIGQIIINTPLWVWALLAFLSYRAVLASFEREVRFKKMFIMPFVMLALSIQGIATTFSHFPDAALVWLACTLLASILVWQLFGGGSITANYQRGTITMKGSWQPLALMMGIFITKYAVSVAFAIHPEYKQNADFAMMVCVLYGVLNGIMIGNLLRAVSVFRQSAIKRPLSAA
jgi:hypothetical protein